MRDYDAKICKYIKFVKISYLKMIHARDAALLRRNVRDTRVCDTATATATAAATAI